MDELYREAEDRIEQTRLSGATKLDLSGLELAELPQSLLQLTQLKTLDLSRNQLSALPEALGQLTQLQTLSLFENQLSALPETLGQLTQLQTLSLFENQLSALPETLGQLTQLQRLGLSGNELKDLPISLSNLVNLEHLILGDQRFGGNPLGQLPDCVPQLISLQYLRLCGCQLTDLPRDLIRLERLGHLDLRENPLNPELAAAYEEGLEAIWRYLRQKAEAVALNEAKLILVGEGEVGKSCLLAALRGDPWVEGRPTTHGIEIKPFQVTDPETGTNITLNGWDFGGQRVYRPTHQLFFSSPAVYLVVWKPREGSQQGLVKEWIKLVKLRVPEARILVVATHGGPGERLADIDRQEIWDLFGRDVVLDFLQVESKPEASGLEGRGLPELKAAIARVAASLPETGRKVPAHWQRTRRKLSSAGVAYLPYSRVLEICREEELGEEDAQLFVTISHRLGHLIHYEHDPALRDLVVLKPDWLAAAISLVFDDEETRDAHGLASFARLSQVWNDAGREEALRYPPALHPVFLRLMERFDLSYRVAGLPEENTSLIGQLVPDVRPEPLRGWPPEPAEDEEQQVQICRIVESGNGQPAPAEGLFYQLIVRLHKYSLGRTSFQDSQHWQRGLVLDDDYNGRALLEQVGNDVRITVRAAYPERFLSVLTSEVRWLVESFWKGLRCDVMVPCISPCGRKAPGTGLYEVQKLIEARKRKRPDYPCPVCDEWQGIDALLRNAPAASRKPLEEQVAVLQAVVVERFDRQDQRFDRLDRSDQMILSQLDEAFSGLMQALTDEAKDGPRLFSLEAVEPGFLDRPKWVSAMFRLTLWCEHSRLPLPSLNGEKDRSGAYELSLPRDWIVSAAPFLKVLSGTLGLVLPVAASGAKLLLDAGAIKAVERQLDFGQKGFDSLLKGGEKAGGWLALDNAPDLKESEGAVRASGPILRQLHAWLKKEDSSFGGLVRVQNRRREFLWVHPQFVDEY